MRILLTNDDGIDAHGLQLLRQHLAQSHDVTVVAPAENQSGVSSALSLRKPVALVERDSQQFAVAGTPADCVQIALATLPEWDLLISGPNAGANMGCDTLYSGTVAAALEARGGSRPALAISLCCDAGSNKNEANYLTVVRVVEQLLKQPEIWADMPVAAININVPDVAEAELQGWCWTRLGRRQAAEVATLWPGRDDAWCIGAAGAPADFSDGTDFAAVAANYVSLTPLMIDLTAHSILQAYAGKIANAHRT